VRITKCGEKENIPLQNGTWPVTVLLKI